MDAKQKNICDSSTEAIHWIDFFLKVKVASFLSIWANFSFAVLCKNILMVEIILTTSPSTLQPLDMGPSPQSLNVFLSRLCYYFWSSSIDSH